MEVKHWAEDLIMSAKDMNTSDIFITGKQDFYEVNFRTSKGLIRHEKLNLQFGLEVINYFKFIAQMDVSEHRRPQVGSYIFKNNKQSQVLFLRFSVLGEFSGKESLVIRLINGIQNNRYFFIEQVDLLTAAAIKRGLILTSGPTGSGKTSTMYYLAKKLAHQKVVMTIEDPVEVFEPEFLQTQINLEAGIDYESLLKAALRQRPDILIIGEIRDKVTARLAVDAALSGHLVLATVHARSTLQTIARLKGLGIDSVELANCLNCVSYQRLIQTIDGEIACLLDIASGETLHKEINKSKTGDFINWRENLAELLKEERISGDSFTSFQEG
ncbi:Flp pilus assembly complex ATPase component TadA [Lactobacillus mulieris]|uniref:competence type IV pilus ATPase ComGA n=1 Tax=Lactobacillus mulieris TaxID=2508708 RepID=UPI001432D257|nr:competence type IV pilus ATPase ComGA [Lactobacillus mulieris]MCF1784246.1 Flp pilus assembly complex ATPase component TadA [Lactobacillus mulieris]MCW8103697.1 competence type IV pilus ATPase ComGA [Lactobacillus mulieris]MDK6802768.1 competence type IV pilus ATPase ComGA [Lactobacillus mulieris]MDK8381884.1 competence type IV pilus ATPase ComGA [Lactobacillus mulieris]MDT9620093.1 competence type IV pilus ATPase ComGA [Lactobacillus mulieris]